MKADEFTIKYPGGFELALRMNKEEMIRYIRLMAALKMFELGKISSGKAAELAGLSRVKFLDACGRYRVSIINYPPDEAEQEIKNDLETLNEIFAK